MNLRTDLALERSEMLGNELPDGIECEIISKSGVKLTRIEVLNENGAHALGKPIGKYITAEVMPFSKSAQPSDEAIEVIADELRALLPSDGTVLVAGLGNSAITPDALGPKCAGLIFATRHIGRELADIAGLGRLRPVASLVPGVLGNTGMEAGEILSGTVRTVKPAAVITVDALAARKMSRLGCTVQMSDSGISPGSGVGNARAELNRESLGVPVIAIGVPTVVDASTLARDMIDPDDSERIAELENDGAEAMMITPREIDLVIEHASKLIAMAINRALQPHISSDDIMMLVS